jgi:hypothetical protein
LYKGFRFKKAAGGGGITAPAAVFQGGGTGLENQAGRDTLDFPGVSQQVQKIRRNRGVVRAALKTGQGLGGAAGGKFCLGPDHVAFRYGGITEKPFLGVKTGNGKRAENCSAKRNQELAKHKLPHYLYYTKYGKIYP